MVMSLLYACCGKNLFEAVTITRPVHCDGIYSFVDCDPGIMPDGSHVAEITRCLPVAENIAQVT